MSSVLIPLLGRCRINHLDYISPLVPIPGAVIITTLSETTSDSPRTCLRFHPVTTDFPRTSSTSSAICRLYSPSRRYLMQSRNPSIHVHNVMRNLLPSFEKKNCCTPPRFNGRIIISPLDSLRTVTMLICGHGRNVKQFFHKMGFQHQSVKNFFSTTEPGFAVWCMVWEPGKHIDGYD